MGTHNSPPPKYARRPKLRAGPKRRCISFSVSRIDISAPPPNPKLPPPLQPNTPVGGRLLRGVKNKHKYVIQHHIKLSGRKLFDRQIPVEYFPGAIRPLWFRRPAARVNRSPPDGRPRMPDGGVEGVVDVGAGGEVEDGVDLLGPEEVPHQIRRQHVPHHELEPCGGGWGVRQGRMEPEGSEGPGLCWTKGWDGLVRKSRLSNSGALTPPPLPPRSLRETGKI